MLWAVSSVGRASRLHRGGQRFESFTAHQNYGGVAQLVRAIACHAIGRGFESLHSRHQINEQNIALKCDLSALLVDIKGAI